jgi:hypothetical protein
MTGAASDVNGVVLAAVPQSCALLVFDDAHDSFFAID